MALMPQIFPRRELWIDALRLKDHANAAAQGPGFADGVEAGDGGPPGGRHHERREYAEEGRLAAAIGSKQSEQFGRLHVERDTIQSGAVRVAVN